MKTLLIILITAFISVCSIQAQEKGSMVDITIQKEKFH